MEFRKLTSNRPINPEKISSFRFKSGKFNPLDKLEDLHGKVDGKINHLSDKVEGKINNLINPLQDKLYGLNEKYNPFEDNRLDFNRLYDLQRQSAPIGVENVEEIEKIVQQQYTMTSMNTTMQYAVNNYANPDHSLDLKTNRCQPALVNLEEKQICQNNEDNDDLKDSQQGNSWNFEDQGEKLEQNVRYENVREKYVLDMRKNSNIINAIQ